MKSLHTLKTSILFFWALWFSFATLTNVMDLFYQFSFLSDQWKFVSHNFSLVKGVMAIYGFSLPMVTIVFIAIVLVEIYICILFWMASIQFNRKAKTWRWINAAFTFSIFLWASFLVGEEMFIAYAFESTHVNLLMAELISLMAIRLLPE